MQRADTSKWLRITPWRTACLPLAIQTTGMSHVASSGSSSPSAPAGSPSTFSSSGNATVSHATAGGHSHAASPSSCSTVASQMSTPQVFGPSRTSPSPMAPGVAADGTQLGNPGHMPVPQPQWTPIGVPVSSAITGPPVVPPVVGPLHLNGVADGQDSANALAGGFHFPTRGATAFSVSGLQPSTNQGPTLTAPISAPPGPSSSPAVPAPSQAGAPLAWPSRFNSAPVPTPKPPQPSGAQPELSRAEERFRERRAEMRPDYFEERRIDVRMGWKAARASAFRYKYDI